MPDSLFVDLYHALWVRLFGLDRYARKSSPGQMSLFGDEGQGKHDVSQEPRDAKGEWTANGSQKSSKPDVDSPASVATIKQDENKPVNEPAKGGPMKRVVKTKSGIEVSLESGPEGTRVELQHPQAGKIVGNLTHWDKQKGVAYTDAYVKNQHVGLSISQAEYDTAVADVKAAKAKQLDDIRSGATPITLRYQDGEYLAGHSVSGPEADMLVQLGVAQDISGWGTHVEPKLVDALGTSFTYQQAADYAKPRLDAAQEKKDEAKAARDAKFAEAKQTGNPVLLHHHTEAVTGHEEEETENSMNVVYVYAMPDGTTKTKRHGTY